MGCHPRRMPPRSSWGPGAAAPLGQSRQRSAAAPAPLSLTPQCERSEALTAKPQPRPPPCGCPHGGAAVQAGTQRRRSSHGLMAPISTGGCDQESADGRGAALRSADPRECRAAPGPRPHLSARTRDYASQRPPRPCGGAGHSGSCSSRVDAPSLAERFRRPRALHFPWGSAAGPAAETFASPVSPRWRRGEGGALAPAAPTAAAAAGRGESAAGVWDEARPGVPRAGGEWEGAGRGAPHDPEARAGAAPRRARGGRGAGRGPRPC